MDSRVKNTEKIPVKHDLATRIDKLTFAILMILNSLRDGKEVDGENVVLVIPKVLAKQIEDILTK
jgi:hypothetical protein